MRRRKSHGLNLHKWAAFSEISYLHRASGKVFSEKSSLGYTQKFKSSPEIMRYSVVFVGNGMLAEESRYA